MECTLCSETGDQYTLKCSGFCGGLFHISCLSKKNIKYKNALLTTMDDIPNLRWFCDSCTVLPIDTRNYMAAELSNQLIGIKSFADNLLTKLIPSVLTTQNDIEGMTPLSSTGQSGLNHGALNGSFATAETESVDMEDIQTMTPESPKSNVAGVSNVTARRKRPPSPGLSPQSKQIKVADKQQSQPKPIPTAEQQQQQQLTKPASLADMVAKPKAKVAPGPTITVKTNMVRSIYISPFVPTTESSHIMSHLESIDDLKHIIPNIVCTKLAGKNRRLSFVSFKLDVPRHHFDIIVNPSIWQMNGKDEITIKDFIEKRKVHGQGINENKNNPFSKPPLTHTKNQNQKNIGTSHKQKTHGPPKFKGKQQQSQGQNFRHRCQKLCCSQPRPQCYRCHDHYEENRYAHRPKNLH